MSKLLKSGSTSGVLCLVGTLGASSQKLMTSSTLDLISPKECTEVNLQYQKKDDIPMTRSKKTSSPTRKLTKHTSHTPASFHQAHFISPNKFSGFSFQRCNMKGGPLAKVTKPWNRSKKIGKHVEVYHWCKKSSLALDIAYTLHSPLLSPEAGEKCQLHVCI